MHRPTQTNRDTVIVVILWTLIALGIVYRLVNPFFKNPIDFLVSDPYRHYLSAVSCLQTGGSNAVLFEILDPLGYQIWLSSVLRITGGARIAIALYAGSLSILTAWFWYRWMRLCLGNKTLALAGFAILSVLPDWTRGFQFFLQETLVLPLLGLALWVSWETKLRPSSAKYIGTGVAWGCALLTKVTVLPMAAVALGWLLWKTAPGFVSNPNLKQLKKLKMPLIAIAIAFCICALNPIKIFNRIHAFIPIPSADLQRVFYESGKSTIKATVKLDDIQQGYKEYPYEAGAPALELPLPWPFEFKTRRTGTYVTVFDYTAPFGNYCEPSHMTVQDRLYYTWENIVYFFLGLCWPENIYAKDLQPGIYADILRSVRFIWLPITIAIAILSIKKKQLDVMTVLFFTSLAFFLFQQSGVMEARYKKPWEGVAIATLLALIAKPSSRSAAKDAEPTN